MQLNSLKKNSVNIFFTVLAVVLLVLLGIEAKIYFINQVKLLNKTLIADVTSFKVKNEESVAAFVPSKGVGFGVNDLNIKKNIKTFKNLHLLESEASSPEVVDEVSEIASNPLLKGFYVGLGIFKTKDAANEAIKFLMQRNLINDTFLAYIETKTIQEKQFFLPQIGVFSGRQDAISFCDNLQKVGVGCIIID